MSTPQSWSGGGRRQADEVGWSWKVTEMGQGTDKDKKGKKGGHTMTEHQECWDSIGSSRNDQQCHFLVRSSQESHDLSGASPPFQEWLGGLGSPRLHIQ